jgi:hypothetical protein
MVSPLMPTIKDRQRMPADGTIAAHYSQPTSAPSGGLQTTSALKIEIEAYNAIFFKGVTLTFFPFSFFLFPFSKRLPAIFNEAHSTEFAPADPSNHLLTNHFTEMSDKSH